MVYIETNVLKMNVNEAYSMLLTHEARLESSYSYVSTEAKMNYVANLEKRNYNAGWNNNNQGNWTKNYPGN